MDNIVMEGGVPLSGEIEISGAKNAALPIFAATLLADGEFTLHNVPQLGDIRTIVNLLQELGADVRPLNGSSWSINSEHVRNHEAPYELVKTMRASCLVLGPLLSRLGRAKVSLPGGCAIGERPIDLHLKGLHALGAEIMLDHGYVEVRAAGRLTGARIELDTVTVTGTMNLMMAAALARGHTIIENAAREPEVIALADFLNAMGARVSGAGTAVIAIDGVDELHAAQTTVIPDRIEAGTFMIAAAITGGDVTVKGVVPEQVANITDKLIECGCGITETGSDIRVAAAETIRSVDVATAPFPGFPTDMQAQFMALMTLADGAAVITENIFENRYMHVAELRRMGADIKVSGHAATVRGVRNLSGAPLMATDLRASASLILAGLAAKGETTVSRVYHLDRGYERIEEKLKGVGAAIHRVKGS